MNNNQDEEATSPAPVGGGLVRARKAAIDVAKDIGCGIHLCPPDFSKCSCAIGAEMILHVYDSAAAATITRLEQRERELVEFVKDVARVNLDYVVEDWQEHLIHRARALLKDTKP